MKITDILSNALSSGYVIAMTRTPKRLGYFLYLLGKIGVHRLNSIEKPDSKFDK